MSKKPWWMCLLEWELVNSENWELVHDGQRNPMQFEFRPEEVRCFTRKYRSKKSGGWLGLIRGVTFKYDFRIGWADIVGIEFTSEDSTHRKSREAFELTERKGVAYEHKA